MPGGALSAVNWPVMAPMLALLALLVTRANAGFIKVVCERPWDVKPFCGRYEQRGDVYEYNSGDKLFTIKESRAGQDIEFCLQLRKRLKLCGRQHLDELVRVSGVNRDVFPGYIMEFHGVDPKVRAKFC